MSDEEVDAEISRWDALFVIISPKSMWEAFVMGAVTALLLTIVSALLGSVIPDSVFEVLFP